jgi:hypothetical protein
LPSNVNHIHDEHQHCSVGAVCCSLPGLKHTEDGILALEIFQIVEEVKAHIPLAKQDVVSVPSLFLELLFDIYLI